MSQTPVLDEESKRHSKLVAQVKKGDSAALDKLLDIFIPQLKAFFRYLHVPESSLEDMVQETFEHMINKLDSFDETKRFSSWLMTMGRNLYLDQYRRQNRGEEIIKSQIPDASHNTDPEKEALSNATVEELLGSLDSKERFLIEMRVFQKMPFAEIAELTGEQEVTLRSRFFRTISRLKTIA